MKTIYVIYHVEDFWLLCEHQILSLYYADSAMCGAEQIARTVARALETNGIPSTIVLLERTELINQTMEEEDLQWEGETLTLAWLIEHKPELLFHGGQTISVYEQVSVA